MPAPGTFTPCDRHPDRRSVGYRLCSPCRAQSIRRGLGGRLLEPHELLLLDYSVVAAQARKDDPAPAPAPAPFSDEPELRAQLDKISRTLDDLGIDIEDRCADDAEAIRERVTRDARTIARLRATIERSQSPQAGEDPGALMLRAAELLEAKARAVRAWAVEVGTWRVAGMDVGLNSGEHRREETK